MKTSALCRVRSSRRSRGRATRRRAATLRSARSRHPRPRSDLAPAGSGMVRGAAPEDARRWRRRRSVRILRHEPRVIAGLPSRTAHPVAAPAASSRRACPQRGGASRGPRVSPLNRRERHGCHRAAQAPRRALPDGRGRLPGAARTSEHDLQIAAARNDLTRSGMHDAKAQQRPRELMLVARARTDRQRPGHFGERDSQRVRWSADGQARRDRSL